jgi:hypothetical protein
VKWLADHEGARPAPNQFPDGGGGGGGTPDLTTRNRFAFKLIKNVERKKSENYNCVSHGI